jgi:cyclopropane-fatty-acyl-phospholipid synthase
MAFSNTAALRLELERALPERPFSVSFWDGTSVPATTPDGPTFFVRSPKALATLLRAPGELGLGRAYAQGLIEVDDIDGAISVVDNFEAPAITLKGGAKLAVALLRANGLTLPPAPPETELRLRGERHTIARDRRAVRHHYDSGNDFFKLFLDPSMTYSCAYWRNGATTLEEAQKAKLDLICKKLDLQPGERLLDVGCGWGSMALNAARERQVKVLGISLSQPQVDEATKRAAERGLSELVEFRVCDYREVPESEFDAISSIGMVEHVGEERIDLYMSTLHGLLRSGGRLLNHGIAKLADFDTKDEGAISERFVFPDGVPLPLSRIAKAMERTGLVPQHVEGIGPDYALTITEWIKRYEARYDEAVALAGEERARMYKLYLRAARQGFTTNWATVYQVLATKL